jgi:uncharacterized membrane protein
LLPGVFHNQPAGFSILAAQIYPDGTSGCPEIPARRVVRKIALDVRSMKVGAGRMIAAVQLAACGLIALLVAVFPADPFPAYPPVLLWLRLPVQGLLIAWAYGIARSAVSS